MKTNIRSQIESLGWGTQLEKPDVDYRIATGLLAPASVPKRIVRAWKMNGTNTPWRTTWREVLKDVRAAE